MANENNSRSVAPADAIELIRGFFGDARHTSDWFAVTQELADQFAVATCDNHWIHNDPSRARQDSPYGTTVAQGFWTLSLLPHLTQNAISGLLPPGAQFGLNYGLDRIRFPGPVRVGARIRLRFTFVDVACRGTGQYLITTENVIEVEGQQKPALMANWLFLLIYGRASSG